MTKIKEIALTIIGILSLTGAILAPLAFITIQTSRESHAAYPPALISHVGDTNVTLQVDVTAPTIVFSTTLTVNRTVNLSTVGAKNGDSFKIVRSGLGLFTLDITGIKVIPSATAASVEVMYDGAAWILTDYSLL